MIYVKNFLILLLFVIFPKVALGLAEDIALEPKYKALEIVGEGAFGVVVKKDNQVIKIAHLDDAIENARIFLEVALYKALKHKAIPKVVSTHIHKGVKSKYFEVILPYYSNPDNNNFSKIINEMSSVLTYAHELNIAHRDIKTVHILNHGSGSVLIDWGAAEIFTADPVDWVGTTLYYRDPTLLWNETRFPKAADMWSLGVSILEIALDEGYIFTGHNESALLSKIFSKPPDRYSSSFEEFLKNGQTTYSLDFLMALYDHRLGEHQKSLRGLLELDPDKRLVAKELWKEFRDYNDKQIIKLPPTPKAFTFNNKIRREAYSQLNKTNGFRFSHPNKVVFEAMSIADRFIETTPKINNLKLVLIVAYYLSANFHNVDLSAQEAISMTDIKLTYDQFAKLILEFLIRADFNLLFNHMLRDFQNELYKNMSKDEREIAITVLKMLEIDENTFAFSNKKKWKLVSEVLRHALSDKNKKILQSLCQSFKNDYLANSEEYGLICRKDL